MQVPFTMFFTSYLNSDTIVDVSIAITPANIRTIGSVCPLLSEIPVPMSEIFFMAQSFKAGF